MTLTPANRTRLRAAAIHLTLSGAIAIVVALVTLSLWYPGAFAGMAGGRSLFKLVVAVDVVMGPLLTLVVFNTAKPRRELVRDMAVIGTLQIAALAYGLDVLFQARPVALVFEVDRFRVIAANEVRAQELPQAAPPYRSLPFTGPWVIGTRATRSGDEKLEAIDLALAGYDIGQRPTFWQPYSDSRTAALAAARPVEVLLKRYPARGSEIDEILRDARLTRHDARFLPLVARGDWVAIVDSRGDVAGYAALDGFF